MKSYFILIVMLLFNMQLLLSNNENPDKVKAGENKLVSANGVVHILDPALAMNVMGISPNGEYVTGFVRFDAYSFYWTEADGLVPINGVGSEAYDISNTGIIAGKFYDPDITYEELIGWDDDGNEIFESFPLLTAAYYSGGIWHSLGVKPGIELDGFSGSNAEAISADGTIIGGSMASESWALALAPVIWTNGVPTDLESVSTGQGARIQGMSADGQVAAGWAAPSFDRKPVVWINGVMKKITLNGMWLNGEAKKVSRNGKYVALDINDKAAIYDVENEKLTVIGKSSDALFASATDISDNGIVVGFNNLGMGMYRAGFIYTDQLGMRDLTAYLVEAGIVEAENFSFGSPMGISTDGHRIVGFNDELVGWIVDIQQHLTGFNPPKELTLSENGYGNVILTWEAAANDTGNTLSGYNIYRNNTKLNSSVVNATTFTDNSIPTGNYVYKVTAVWNGNQESVPTREAMINIGKVSLPFLEDFSTLSFNDNYWNVSTESESRWIVSDYMGINPPGVGYFTPTGTFYEEYLVSPYIDATNAEALNLSFNIVVATVWDNISNEKFKVEVSDGTAWHTVAEYTPIFDMTSFEYKEFDISEYAAGKEFRVRFVAYGDNAGDALIWQFDNVNVFTPDDALILSVPQRVSAYKMEDGSVHVNWADPGEVAKLSYLENTSSYDAIGNDGIPFIASAKFDALDIIGYQGYKMVSISAYLSHTVEENLATYRLAVFNGSERIVSQDITTFKVNEWNTFTLDNPIIFSKEWNQPLYFGIEVVTHHTDDWPIGLCERPIIDWETWEFNYEGRSNLYSNDGGATWGVLTDFDIYGSVGVTANLEGKDGAKAKERLLGYKVFRQDENMLG
jgi:uncharacterized membrane protein